jgi:AraC family transcriptional regulator
VKNSSHNGALLKHHTGIIAEVERIPKIKQATRQELYKRLNYARDFIDSCYHEDINLDSISAIACLNREYFIRQFKSYFKTTPAQYLIRRRMDAARQLLQIADMDISEVCERVGYSDLSSFGKLFRRYYGVSPTEVKKAGTK